MDVSPVLGQTGDTQALQCSGMSSEPQPCSREHLQASGDLVLLTDAIIIWPGATRIEKNIQDPQMHPQVLSALLLRMWAEPDSEKVVLRIHGETVLWSSDLSGM